MNAGGARHTSAGFAVGGCSVVTSLPGFAGERRAQWGGADGMFSRFFKKPDPKELVRKWQRDIRGEMRQLDRQMRDLQREEKKAEKLVKEAAKNNDMTSAKTIARELVGVRKGVNRLYQNKAQMVSMNAHLTEQLGVARVAGTLQKSTELMGAVNELIKLPELNKQMQEMAKEMMKAGIIEEMVDDVMDDVMDSEDMEEEVDAEVEK
eukprot:jgi/Tetstr1/424759/TSEL_015276.t1